MQLEQMLCRNGCSTKHGKTRGVKGRPRTGDVANGVSATAGRHLNAVLQLLYYLALHQGLRNAQCS